MLTRIETDLRAGFYDAINAEIRGLLSPRVRRKPSVWAAEVRVIASGTGVTTNSPICYTHDLMPHCVEPMDAVDDPTVSEIVLWMGIRDGKTNGVCMNVIGRTVTDDPGNICSVHPIDDDADRFSTGDVEPTIEACLEGYFVERRSRDAGRTINFKKFKGGWLRIFSAGSATKFRGTAVKVMCLHELDALDPESIFKAMGRTTGFPDAIVIKESTGTLAAEIDPEGKKVYLSRIEEAYDRGDKRKWFCACRQCGFLQTIKYEQIKYPAGRMDLAKYHCEACDYAHTPAQRWKLCQSGKWYPTAGLTSAQEKDIANNWRHARALEPSVRSYWRNGFNSLLPHGKGFKSKLHEFAAKGEAAQSSVEAKKIWTQEIKAELWTPESQGEQPPQWKPLYEGREDYGLVIPARGLFLTAYADLQLDRIEVGWEAWGKMEENFAMDHVVLNGHIRDREVWQMLRYELARKFKHESGVELSLGMALVDGGSYAEDAYRFFQELAHNPMPGVTGKCRASKGVGQQGHPIITRKMMTIAKNLKGHHIGTWEAKDRIRERLRMEKSSSTNLPDREGVQHFNKQFGEEFFQQLVVERVVVAFERGQEVRKYENEKRERNEAFDIKVGNLAAYRLHPRNLDAIEEEIKERAEIQASPAKETKPPQESRPQVRGWSL